MPSQKSAFITLATNELYAKSALVLANTLKTVQTKHKTVLMLSNEGSISEDLVKTLKNAFDQVISVDTLITEYSSKYDVLTLRPELAVTFTKMHAFSLTEFDSCCFLDADTMVVENIDHLLETNTNFSACPEFSWPDSFNTGVFTFKPSKSTFDDLMKLAGEQNASYDGGDQGLLNNYFKNNWARLSVLYNMPVSNFGKFSIQPENYGFNPAFMKFGGQTKVVHFLGGGGNKPWSQSTSSDSTVQHFKNMWKNNLKEAMEKFEEKVVVVVVPVVQEEVKVEHQNSSVGGGEKVVQKVDEKPNFEDIWKHISAQF